MTLTDKLRELAAELLHDQGKAVVDKAFGNGKAASFVKEAVGELLGGDGASKTVAFTTIPENLAELQATPEAALASPYDAVALTLAALSSFERDPQAVWEMLDFLKGPEDVTEGEKQFITERLRNKGYKIRSFFRGATPENNYAPTTPWTVVVSANPRSFSQKRWATLYVQSGGADSPREIRLRQKPSTGQWFVSEIMCLGDIRLPKDEDKWA